MDRRPGIDDTRGRRRAASALGSLEVVHECLPLALHDWKDDLEHVHQLRVSTRRAGAALAIFAFCLPGKTLKKIKKRLRRLRRAAGQARDWDVFGQALAERVQNVAVAQRPGLDFLVGYAQAQRVAAQATLEESGGLGPFDLESLIADTIAAVRESDDENAPLLLGEAARVWLSDILNDLHAATADNLDQYEHLHQVRILGKRLRYGMEVFAPCYSDDFKDRYYPKIVEMQDILGLANDSHVVGQRLACCAMCSAAAKPAMWRRFRAGIDGLLHFHQPPATAPITAIHEVVDAMDQTGTSAALSRDDLKVPCGLSVGLNFCVCHTNPKRKRGKTQALAYASGWYDKRRLILPNRHSAGVSGTPAGPNGAPGPGIKGATGGPLIAPPIWPP